VKTNKSASKLMPSKLKATGTLYQQIRKGNSLKVVKGINNNNKKNKEKKVNFY
jgi:hypothetical protein